MNQLQAMMAQANKMKRELKKAQEELEAKEFTVSKGGAVTVTVLGNRKVTSINIDKDAFDPDNKEMIEEMIALAISEAQEQITQAERAYKERITGSPEGY